MGKTKGQSQTRGKSGGKSSAKKQKLSSFSKKEWRHVFVPGYFKKRDIGFTISHKVARGKTPGDYLNNRVFEQSHQDLSDDHVHAYRIFSWKSVGVVSDDVLTIFYGMRLTADKIGSLLRKYRTLIDAQVDVKTPDGYILRLFSICFTKKINNKDACYAQQSKRRLIRDKCIEVMRAVAEPQTVDKLCTALINDEIETKIVEGCQNIWQVENVVVSKVKVLKAPVVTDEGLAQLHKGRPIGKPGEVSRPAEDQATPQEEGTPAAP
jgi:small subunit ribosomal protein S3Ae